MGNVRDGQMFFLHGIPVDEVSFGAFLNGYVGNVFSIEDTGRRMNGLFYLDMHRGDVSAQKVVPAVKKFIDRCKALPGGQRCHSDRCVVKLCLQIREGTVLADRPDEVSTFCLILILVLGEVTGR